MTNPKKSYQQRIFEKYEKVRKSGITNMLNKTKVCNLSGLDSDEYLYIIHNYTELAKKYNK